MGDSSLLVPGSGRSAEEEAKLWPATVGAQPFVVNLVSGATESFGSCVVGGSTVELSRDGGFVNVTTGADDSKSPTSNDAEGGDGLLEARVNGDPDLVVGDDADGLSRGWR
jgi:hypothetical protein